MLSNNDIQHNDTQYKGLTSDAQHNNALPQCHYIGCRVLSIVMLGVTMLSVVMVSVVAPAKLVLQATRLKIPNLLGAGLIAKSKIILRENGGWSKTCQDAEKKILRTH
jgi:hypothetical protein